jgi:tRNA(His) guanylyltransferase
MNRKDFELLGDKHKRFELLESYRLMPGLSYVIRLDGRAFHTFTKGLERPFDFKFTACMVEATKFLIESLHASIGYTQSDEISLGFKAVDWATELPFSGRIQKLASLSAALASVKFNRAMVEFLPGKSDSYPIFDARVFSYPSEDLAAESFLWRETDATRNSLAMASQAYYSSKELHKAGRAKMHEMLFQKGINWNDYPAFFKRGTYVRRGTEEKTLTQDELFKIPEKHRPTGPVTRGIIRSLDMAPVHTITNLARVLFHDDAPIFQVQAEAIE